MTTMTVEVWKEPKPTIDQVRRLIARIRSYARSSRIMSTASSLLLLALVIQMGIMMYAFFLPSFFGGTPIFLPDWFYYVLVITFAVSMLVFGVASTINNRLNRYILEYRKIGVVSQLRCEACSRTSERVWEKGDYIFKPEGTCACGGKQVISQMYIMPLPLKKKGEA
ncbi:MAG: hypothetical protein Q6361_09335 [Candidatus Hermodarchaeota archaeon]|jgi:hypothetical protein|nr:hypothetical protein [Candidatus Hermodarchaeota archaeon]